MCSHNDGLKPSREEYKEFEKDLSEKSSVNSIEIGLTIFLTMLLFIPLIGLLFIIALGILGTGLQIRILIYATILSGLAIFFMFQAYTGLVKQDVQVFRRQTSSLLPIAERHMNMEPKTQLAAYACQVGV